MVVVENVWSICAASSGSGSGIEYIGGEYIVYSCWWSVVSSLLVSYSLYRSAYIWWDIVNWLWILCIIFS